MDENIRTGLVLLCVAIPLGLVGLVGGDSDIGGLLRVGGLLLAIGAFAAIGVGLSRGGRSAT